MDESEDIVWVIPCQIGGVVTTRQAANILGVSVRRVQQLCRSGRLGEKVGDRWLIGGDLEDFARIERPPGRPKKALPRGE
jgi:hypothetical protein